MSSYQAGDRRYYLGGKDLTQSFYDNDSTLAGTNFNNTTNRNNQNQDFKTETFHSEDNPYLSTREPNDYGRDYYDLLRKYHTERTQSQNPSIRDLLNTWRIMKRSENISKGNTFKAKNQFKWTNPYETKPVDPNKKLTVETQTRLYGKPFNDKTQRNNNSANMRDDLIKNRNEMDVMYTLHMHHEDYEYDLDMERKMEKGILARQAQMEEEKKKKKLAAKRKRLKDKLKREREQYASTTKGLATVQVTGGAGATQEADEDKYVRLVTGTVEDHRMKFPDNDDFIYPTSLYNFWKSIPAQEKKQKGLDVKDGIAREVFQNFFDSRIKHVSMEFRKAKGVETSDSKALYRYFKNDIPAREREKMSMVFYSDKNGRKVFKQYCENLKKAKEEEMKKFREEIRQKQENKSKKSKKTRKNGKPGKSGKTEEKKTRQQRIKELSTPKDRLKIGKTLLKLKSHFPEDKILRGMIVEEFKAERVAKRPLEYDNFDSDEEVLMKGKQNLAIQNKEDIKKDELMAERAERLREEELLQRFTQMCKHYNVDKNSYLKQKKDYVKQYKQENDKIEAFLLKKAQEWRKLTMNKLNEKIPSETEFLSSTYHEMKTAHPSATKRLYPHSTAGESKEMAKKSFPLTFKHEFFKQFRTLEKKKLRQATKNNVGFWAPSGSKQKTSHNKKIISNAKDTKFKDVWDTRDKDTVWERDEFQDERKQILMKLDDAENCTFRPIVRSKLPKSMQIAPTEGAYDKPEGLKKLIEKNKDSLEGLKLKKKGIFKKALFEFCNSRSGPIPAYELLCKNFNIKQIRTELGDPKKDRPPPKGSKLYKILHPEEKKTLEKKKKHFQLVEDMKDPVYKEFLYEVLDLVRMIEGHQKEVAKTKKLTKKLMATENKKPVKEFMCPLMEKCPDFEADRWPMSNVPGTKILGKKCPFAHHTYELYFEAQKKNKEKYLKHLDEQLLHNIKTGKITGEGTPFRPSGSIQTNCQGLMKDRIDQIENMLKKERKVTAQVADGGKDEKEDKDGKEGKEVKDGKEDEKKKPEEHLTRTEKLKKSKKVQEKIKFMREEDERLRKKLGFLRRSETLYAKGRYKEAFDTIIKAIRIVKMEEEKDEEIEEDRKDFLREKLGLEDGFEITAEQLMRLQEKRKNPTKDIDMEVGGEPDPDADLLEEKYQKIVLFAEKTNVIGYKKYDVKQNTKDLIEEQYERIVKKLKFDELGIVHMKTAADKLRKKVEKMNDSFEPSPMLDENAETQQPEKRNAKEEEEEPELSTLHGHWKYTGPKDTIENPWRPKDPEKTLPLNVDLVDDKQKLKQLDEAIKICTKKLVESKANKPWMYTGPKDTIENMFHVDYVREWVPPKYNPNEENSDDEYGDGEPVVDEKKKAARNHPSVPKFNVKEKSRMYEKEYSEIKKYPWKIKYEDYLDDEESGDDEYPQLGGGGRKREARGRKKKNQTPSEVTPDETISVGEDFGF